MLEFLLLFFIISTWYFFYKSKTKQVVKENFTTEIKISFELEEITKADLIRFQSDKELLIILLKMIKNKIIKWHELLRLTRDTDQYAQIQWALNTLHELYNEINYIVNPDL